MSELVAVDSVVYNMAGDITERASYLKTLVVQSILSDSDESAADAIRRGYFSGPATKLRLFYQWAKTAGNYDLIGMPTGKLELNGKIPPAKVALEIPAVDGKLNKVEQAKVGYADPKYWADRYMLNNHEDLFDTDWEYEYLESSNEIRITFIDTTTAVFTASNFNYDDRYLYAYFHRVDTVTKTSDSTKVFIYKIGSGNADLDALVEDKADYGEFFPFIPVRLENKFLSDSYKPSAFTQVKAAYKKATGADLEDLISDLKENDDLGDIDHAYITFGVSLNVKDNSCRRYIWEFFKSLQAAQQGGADAYDEYKQEFTAYKRAQAKYDAWKARGKKGDEPARPTEPSVLKNMIRIRGTGDVNSRYDVRIEWNYIDNGTRLGRGKVGAKKGDYWFKAKKISLGDNRKMVWDGFTHEYKEVSEKIETTRLRLYYQRTRHEYDYIDVIGATHRNVIYKGRSVLIDPIEALDDAEESGFIIPLHYDTWKKIGMVDRTQMGTACVFAVFNCYKARKKKWYESWIFQVFLVIVIAIASAVFTGGAGIGLLGSHMAIGTALGLTGISAAILGSIVNSLAAMVLTTVLQKVASGLGGFGAILSALIGFVIGSASSLTNGSLSFDWSSLLKADNLLKLLSSVGNAFSTMIQQDTAGIYQSMVDFQENAQDKIKEIQQEFFDQFGYGGGIIDPMMFVQQHQIKIETASTFLTRTLMTGSEVVEMSQELLSDFPKYSLSLPDAFN